jgi:DNA-binding response OmpR family regulator
MPSATQTDDTPLSHCRSILVVEDDAHIARLVEMHLRDAGHDVRVVSTAAEGRVRAARDQPDLIVLDLMLPDGDGLDVCRALREKGDHTPILILTARDDEVDRVLGLELGADDYLTKPFGVRELMARVKAILRRVEVLTQESQLPSRPIRVDDLEIDPQRRRVRVGNRQVHLTAKEFDLLLQFARQPGRVYTRSQLLDLVWGYGAGCYEHTVNSHINRLRGKIEEDPGNPRYITTVWGVGYRFLEADATG